METRRLTLPLPDGPVTVGCDAIGSGPDALLLPARLGRPEEAREEVVPATGPARSDRSDAHEFLLSRYRFVRWVSARRGIH